MKRGVIGRCDTYYDLLENHGRRDRGSKIEAGAGIGIGIGGRLTARQLAAEVIEL